MRTIVKFTPKNLAEFQLKALQWASESYDCVYLNGNNYPDRYTAFHSAIAFDSFTSIKSDYNDVFERINEYQQLSKDWLFGFLSYDLKNDTEKLSSSNFDGLEFPDIYFFQPKKLLLFTEDSVAFHYLKMVDDEIQEDYYYIEQSSLKISDAILNDFQIKPRVGFEDYIKGATTLLEHIQQGDIYEANYCMEYYAEKAQINPLATYHKLNQISQAPFSAYFKMNQHFVLCSSPERYLRIEGNTVISQPIKGTAKRSFDPQEDEQIKIVLTQNQKERSENIMIVDLVRNDLSRTATRKSVEVTELCGAYTFKQVHHLISTITATKRSDCSPVDVIKESFPMGSMTGAPKISAMEIIEKVEATKRGVYSGAIGYFTPEGNCDFNVVIRSILYNAQKEYLSYSVGSAITDKCIPEQEYNECLLKAEAMRKVLTKE